MGCLGAAFSEDARRVKTTAEELLLQNVTGTRNSYRYM